MAQPPVQTIHRDPALFWWIVIPVTIVMILTGLLRHYATVLLQSTPKKQPLAKIREQRALLRGVNLRTNANVISPSSFEKRKEYLVAGYKDGSFLADPEGRGKPPPNPLSDPAMMDGMMGMMKGNVAMMVPQTLIMGWINAFFSGFIIMKLPFPLTPQMNPGAGMMGAGNDPDKLFQAEAENLEVIDHQYILDDIEERLLASLT